MSWGEEKPDGVTLDWDVKDIGVDNEGICAFVEEFERSDVWGKGYDGVSAEDSGEDDRDSGEGEATDVMERAPSVRAPLDFAARPTFVR